MDKAICLYSGQRTYARLSRDLLTVHTYIPDVRTNLKTFRDVAGHIWSILLATFIDRVLRSGKTHATNDYICTPPSSHTRGRGKTKEIQTRATTR